MEISREQLKDFALTAPDNTAVYHVRNGMLETLFLSANVPGLLSLSREEYLKITEKDAMDLTIPQDRAGLVAATGRCIRDGQPFDYYYRVYHKTKGFEWVHVYAHVFGTMDGTPLIIAQFSNMTKEGGIFQEILDASDWQAMIIDRASHEILYANRTARMLHGGENASLLDRTCFDFVRGKTEPCKDCIMKEAENGSMAEQVFYNEKSGKWENISCSALTWCGHDAVRVYISDITEKKEKELETARNHQMYVDASQEAKLIVWTYDSKKHCVRMMKDGYSGEICKKLGVPAILENVPDSLVPFVGEEDRDAFRGCYTAIDGGVMSAECEFRFRLPAQESQQYERMTLKRILDENGSLLAVYGSGLNVTRQKQAEEKFNKAYQQINNPNSYGSFHLNLTANQCGDGNLGKSRMKSVLALQDSGTADGFFLAFSKLIADETIRRNFLARFACSLLLKDFEKGTERVSVEYPILKEDGQRQWLEGFLDMIKNPRTGEIEAVAYSYDIDARKRDEQIMERLIHDNFDFIGILHPDSGKLEFRSLKPGAVEQQGAGSLSYENYLQLTEEKITEPEERSRFHALASLPHILQELGTRNRFSLPCILSAEGKAKSQDLQYGWLDRPDGEILVLCSDTTEAYEKNREQMRRIQEAMLEANRANEAKSVFLSTMSHDLRTPLNGMIGFTDIALTEKDPEKKQAYLRKIKASGDLLLNLVNDTLELSRIESGKAVVEAEPVRARECTIGIVEALRPTAEEKGVTLKLGTELQDEIIWADRTKLQKIQLNVISNAVKYTLRGGTVTVSDFVLDPPVNGCNRRFVVEDTGIGMSREFMKRMFEPYAQELRKEAGNTGGTGLGLSIVKRYVELSGGTIGIESELGKGTKVTIDMPVRLVEPDTVPAEIKKRAENPDTEILRGKTVLLCEDNSVNAEIALLLLKDCGIRTEWAHDGKEGVERFSRSAPGYFDGILMDIRMPVMNGYEAAKEIRALARKDAAAVPIIAMTADAFSDDVKKCLEAGMDGHLAKPIDRMNLYRILAEHINKKKQEAKNDQRI